jgi:hypothetical protein
MLRVISLGAGVQSTTMSLMAALGEIGSMPDCAIFADTGWEPMAVYEHLARLEAVLPFPVYRVSGGNIREDSIAGGSARAGRYAAVPWFIRNADGSHGMGRRRWPLIEAGMNRSNCRGWLTRHGWNAPKSSCIGCPFHSAEQWRSLRPDEIADAIVVDKAIRHQAGSKGEQFMHSSLRPLSEVDLRSYADIGQADLFNNECEGMCGV